MFVCTSRGDFVPAFLCEIGKGYTFDILNKKNIMLFMGIKENKEHIKEHEAAINMNDAKDFFCAFPDEVGKFKQNDRKAVIDGLDMLDKKFQILVPFVREIKKHLKEGISERTKFSACFLLYHKVVQGWNAIKLLAEAGYYQESMELFRSIKENCDLANLFIFEIDGENLKKWFDGEIIQNRVARENFEKVLNNSKILPKEIKVSAVQASVYSGFSNYTHAGYATMLESIDVFRKDFDIEKVASYHRLHEILPSFEQFITSFRLSLTTYFIVAGDKEKVNSLRKLDSVPVFSPQQIVEIVEKKFGKYKV